MCGVLASPEPCSGLALSRSRGAPDSFCRRVATPLRQLPGSGADRRMHDALDLNAMARSGNTGGQDASRGACMLDGRAAGRCDSLPLLSARGQGSGTACSWKAGMGYSSRHQLQGLGQPGPQKSSSCGPRYCKLSQQWTSALCTTPRLTRPAWVLRGNGKQAGWTAAAGAAVWRQHVWRCFDGALSSLTSESFSIARKLCLRGRGRGERAHGCGPDELEPGKAGTSPSPPICRLDMCMRC